MRLSFCHGLPTLQTQNLTDQMKGINEHQWEEDEHDKDFTQESMMEVVENSSNAWI